MLQKKQRESLSNQSQEEMGEVPEAEATDAEVSPSHLSANKPFSFFMYAFHSNSFPPSRSRFCSTRPPTSRHCLGSRRCRRTRLRQGSSATQTTHPGAAEASPHLGVIKITHLINYLPHLRRRRSRLIGLFLLLPVRGLSTPPAHDLHPFSPTSTQAAPCVKVRKERSKTKPLSCNSHSSPPS